MTRRAVPSEVLSRAMVRNMLSSTPPCPRAPRGCQCYDSAVRSAIEIFKLRAFARSLAPQDQCPSFVRPDGPGAVGAHSVPGRAPRQLQLLSLTKLPAVECVCAEEHLHVQPSVCAL